MLNSISSTKPQPPKSVSWAPPHPPNRRLGGCCIAGVIIPLLLIAFLVGIFFLGAERTNILLLGLNSREPGSDLGRSDTMILTTFVPRQPYIGMLSIPRDLWVSIPEYGENRINTAHFFAEADLPGSGPKVAMQTVHQNFGVDVHYYVRIPFDGFLDIVDLLDGLEIELSVAMSGYPAGTHFLNGDQALAFVRDRSGSDDFSRMQRSQIFLKALLKRMLEPSIWKQFPDILPLFVEMVDTDIPPLKWGYLGIIMLWVGLDGIDTHIITREFTIPFTTSAGAQVLAPDWNMINPVLLEIFGQ